MRASAAWNARHRAAGALVGFSLLGAGCSEAPPPAHCQDEVMAAFKRLETPGVPYRKETVGVYNGQAELHSLLGAGCSEAPPPAHCQDEVMAAFKRLETWGVPYRKETVRIYNGQAEFHMTYEFLPPDRSRYITYNSNPYNTSETIKIGDRTWSRWPHRNDGWSEVKVAIRVLIRDDSKDERRFACLGRIEFDGKAYIGYRARAAESFVLEVLRPQSKKALEEDLAAIRHMPQPWRTVLLEASSLLPAYDLLAQENQFDSPSMSSEHYTYPDDIRIEPPVP